MIWGAGIIANQSRLALMLLLSVYSFVAITPSIAAESPDDRVSFSGDFRLRLEGIDRNQSDDVERARFRARFAIKADIAEDIQLIVRLATGGGNPVSTNQNFGDGFSVKDIGVDRAYVDWKINDTLRLFGGKMKNPYFRAGGNSLIWDSDLNPEGVVAAYKTDTVFGNLGLMVVNEGAGDDVLMVSAQAGFTVKLGGVAMLTAGLGYFDYHGVAGVEPFFNGNAKGNSVDVDGNYRFDYTTVELYAELKSGFNDRPLTVYGEWTQNTEVSIEDTAYVIGVKLGSTGKMGNTEFGYAYHNTEADALIGTFTESDFAGGNTDSSGHFIKAKYVLRDRVVLGATVIISEIGVFAGNERDYDRIMIDLEFKF